MITCTVHVEFDAAVRLRSLDKPCSWLHGHHYVIEAAFTKSGLGDSPIVADYYLLRDRIEEWIKHHWDHTTILHQEDKALGDAIAAITGQPIVYLPNDPSAECLAHYLLTSVLPELFKDMPELTCVSVRLSDAPFAWAEAKL